MYTLFLIESNAQIMHYFGRENSVFKVGRELQPCLTT